MPSTATSPRTPPLAVSAKEAARLLSLSLSKLYELLRNNELQSYAVRQQPSRHDGVDLWLCGPQTRRQRRWVAANHAATSKSSTGVEGAG